MFSAFKRFAFILLVLFQFSGYVQCQTTYASWMFRGQAQQNNTVLTYNKGDVLNLACYAVTTSQIYGMFMVITKASSPPTSITGTSSSGVYTMSVTYSGTLIYDDYNGLQPGYENFLITPSNSLTSIRLAKDIRYISVGYLRPEDAGTYHCTGKFFSTSSLGANLYTSGGLTLVVNTKPGQASTTKTNSNKLLTYSALLMGASKLLL